jgi:hypothetical protein
MTYSALFGVEAELSALYFFQDVFAVLRVAAGVNENFLQTF